MALAGITLGCATGAVATDDDRTVLELVVAHVAADLPSFDVSRETLGTSLAAFLEAPFDRLSRGDEHLNAALQDWRRRNATAREVVDRLVLPSGIGWGRPKERSAGTLSLVSLSAPGYARVDGSRVAVVVYTEYCGVTCGSATLIELKEGSHGWNVTRTETLLLF